MEKGYKRDISYSQKLKPGSQIRARIFIIAACHTFQRKNLGTRAATAWIESIHMAGSDGFYGGEQMLQPQRDLEDGGSVTYGGKSPPVSATVAQI